MMFKIAENLMININEISQVEGNILILRNGDRFKLDDISMRNLNRICKAFEHDLFKLLKGRK